MGARRGKVTTKAAGVHRVLRHMKHMVVVEKYIRFQIPTLGEGWEDLPNMMAPM